MDNAIISSLLQSLFTTVFLGFIGYLVQRKYQFLDGYKMEKNKALLEKTIESETLIFEILNKVRKEYFITVTDLINYSDEINQYRMDRYLYISEEIYNLSRDFSDYLLAVAEDPSKRTKFTEEALVKKFKQQFRK